MSSVDVAVDINFTIQTPNSSLKPSAPRRVIHQVNLGGDPVTLLTVRSEIWSSYIRPFIVDTVKDQNEAYLNKISPIHAASVQMYSQDKASAGRLCDPSYRIDPSSIKEFEFRYEVSISKDDWETADQRANERKERAKNLKRKSSSPASSEKKA